jgi:hypothetical protein
VKTRHAILVLLVLVSVGFTLGTSLEGRAPQWTRRSPEDSVLKLLLGDSRRMFANQFFVKADISFHSGYYPTIFDQARQEEEKDNDVSHPEENAAQEEKSGRHEEEGGFLGAPTDWIDAFGRHFRPVSHTHLSGENVREILPWLKISVDLDPHRIQTYITASYWLRTRLNKINEDEKLLHQGLQANPNDPYLLCELGNLYFENRKDNLHAKNTWLLALRRWHEVEEPKKEPDLELERNILGGLIRVSLEENNFKSAVDYLTQLKKISPFPDAIQKQIDAVQAKANAQK